MSGTLQSVCLILLLLLTWSGSPAAAQKHLSGTAAGSQTPGPVRVEFAGPAAEPTFGTALHREPAQPRFAAPLPQRRASVAPVHPLLITAGASIGGLVGTLVGSRIQEDCETRCINARGTLGPIVANTALVPLGAHAFDRGRGDLLTSALVSAGWGAAAVAAAGLSDQTWPIWAALPGQVISSTIIEWHTARQRARSHPAS